ncbi:MAG: YigZ family protein [Planctomycetes bacterium]|nr:YigZ family protein [Planctomycetota bacterium]
MATVRSFRTVAERCRHEPEKIKGSRHIATVAPVDDDAAIAAVLGEVAREFPAANHHAYGWRLGADGARFRYSDDGEPSGSAGAPILQQIDHLELTRVLVVVSRIFGGTKLGTGGLIRAYGGAAREALAHATIVERVLTAAVEIVHGYAQAGAVAAALHAEGQKPRLAEYGEQTRLVIDVPLDRVEPFAQELRDATGGRAAIAIEWPADD